MKSQYMPLHVAVALGGVEHGEQPEGPQPLLGLPLTHWLAQSFPGGTQPVPPPDPAPPPLPPDPPSAPDPPLPLEPPLPQTQGSKPEPSGLQA